VAKGGHLEWNDKERREMNLFLGGGGPFLRIFGIEIPQHSFFNKRIHPDPDHVPRVLSGAGTRREKVL
jgi:hypothetical protein